MKTKITIFISITLVAIIVGISAYFIVASLPKNIYVYPNGSKNKIFVLKTNVYNVRKYEAFMRKYVTEVEYKDDKEEVIKKLKDNGYFLKQVDNKLYFFNKLPYSIVFEKNYFEVRTLEIGFTATSMPFIDDLMGGEHFFEKKIYDLSKNDFLDNKTFLGLVKFYKDINLKNVIYKEDEIIYKQDSSTTIMIKKKSDTSVYLDFKIDNSLN